jgi:hypothetical protein
MVQNVQCRAAKRGDDVQRTMGRPKRRWNEEVERELKEIGVKDWKRALERDKWKKIVEEAKA